MKRFLMSLLTIALAAALITGGVFAYFTDTETIGPNTFQSGTIDIAINGDNPSESSFSFTDMKPCDWVEYVIEVTNEGTNLGPIYLHFDVGEGYDGLTSEPEQEADPSGTINNIEDWITVDLKIDGYVIIPPQDHVKLSHLDCVWIPLGWLSEGGMTITISFHLQAETPNQYQGDGVDFDVEVMMTDHNKPGPDGGVTLFMENKDAGWNVIADGTFGRLDFGPSGDEFNYGFHAQGLQPTTNYSLIYYADPWAGDNPGALIATFTSDASGVINGAGSADLGMSLPHPDDANYPTGAKIWLVTSSDYDGTKMTAWNPGNYLFETVVIKYQDTDD